MLANDSFFVGLVFQALQGVGFAMHRQYPAGLFAGFVHTQYEKAGLCFGVGGRLEDAASPFNVAGLTLVTRNDPPQPYRTLIPLMDGVREILSADCDKK